GPRFIEGIGCEFDASVVPPTLRSSTAPEQMSMSPRTALHATRCLHSHPTFGHVVTDAIPRATSTERRLSPSRQAFSRAQTPFGRGRQTTGDRPRPRTVWRQLYRSG